MTGIPERPTPSCVTMSIRAILILLSIFPLCFNQSISRVADLNILDPVGTMHCGPVPIGAMPKPVAAATVAAAANTAAASTALSTPEHNEGSTASQKVGNNVWSGHDDGLLLTTTVLSCLDVPSLVEKKQVAPLWV